MILKLKIFILNTIIELLKMGETITGFTMNIIIIGDGKLHRFERMISWLKVHLIIAPLTFALDSLGIWFTDNKAFVSFIATAVCFNLGVGAYTHWKKANDFQWSVLLLKTAEMLIILITTYTVLEMVLILSENSLMTSLFRVTLQVSTLMYPISKILKNIHIISNGEYPPAWLMRRAYNFQKDGDLKNFISSDGNNTKSNNHETN